MRFFPDLRPKTRHTLSVDLTAENQETDALPKTGEAGAECEQSLFGLLLSFSGRTATGFKGRCCQIHLQPAQTEQTLKKNLLSVNILHGNA